VDDVQVPEPLDQARNYAKIKVMAIDTTKLESLRADYKALTQEPCPEFFCPVRYEHGVGDGLMNGHILPSGIKDATRTTVIQRADVDSRFGGTIEPHLIDFINSVTFDKWEFLDKAKDLAVTGGDGKPATLFHASPKSQPPFPKIGLKKDDGTTAVSAFVRKPLAELGTSGVLKVEGALKIPKFAVIGGMLKAAHLALFHLFGYAWVLSPAGRLIGESLGRFVRDPAKRPDPVTHFAAFDGAFRVLWKVGFGWDSLSDRRLLIHIDSSGMGFGISCVFAANGKWLLLTVPSFWASSTEPFDHMLDVYKGYLANPGMKQVVYVAEVEGPGRVAISDKPLPLQFVPNPIITDGAGSSTPIP